MSGHRRVKAFDVDEDDFDDYDEEHEGDELEGGEGGEEEMTDEDKEQMMLGMAKVRSALGEDSKVSDAQIQESLWHYWFDADKTIIYLKSTPAIWELKSASKSDRPTKAAAVKTTAKADESI